MDVLQSGRGLVESPRWHDGRLWFSDWIAGEIIAVDDDGHGRGRGRAPVAAAVLRLPARRPAGARVQPAARAADAGTSTARCPPTPTSPRCRPLGCNDIVVDGRGNAYVNSPNFDFAAGPPPGDVQPGVVALVTPEGAARVVADDIAFPNGMAVTADSRTLVVADSYRHSLVGFDIADDGSLSGRRVWADLGDAAPDGICLDAEGAALVRRRPAPALRAGAPRAARCSQTVELDRGGFACMLERTAATCTSSPRAGRAWPALGDPTHRLGRAGAAHARSRSAGGGWPGN